MGCGLSRDTLDVIQAGEVKASVDLVDLEARCVMLTEWSDEAPPGQGETEPQITSKQVVATQMSLSLGNTLIWPPVT